MVSVRKTQERNDRKLRILEGALSVFNQVGIEKTTMDEIAQESGFGKATLYYYFSSKDEVFIYILEQGWRELWEGIESKVIENIGPRKKFISCLLYTSDAADE